MKNMLLSGEDRNDILYYLQLLKNGEQVNEVERTFLNSLVSKFTFNLAEPTNESVKIGIDFNIEEYYALERVIEIYIKAIEADTDDGEGYLNKDEIVSLKRKLCRPNIEILNKKTIPA
ncbi:hypothetical protein [Vallitalea guaymasensis]|uniref:hypothetical protein n=1 Tax=Vallitalea guaymasensis TaxID=1185412 RepID=UPI000DE29B7B|nr:hypothetical protein [Vallitalea guaymasensis]